jgi:hypothetical protein
MTLGGARIANRAPAAEIDGELSAKSLSNLLNNLSVLIPYWTGLAFPFFA